MTKDTAAVIAYLRTMQGQRDRARLMARYHDQTRMIGEIVLYVLSRQGSGHQRSVAAEYLEEVRDEVIIAECGGVKVSA